MARGRSRRPGNSGGANKSSDAAKRTPDEATPTGRGDLPPESAAPQREAEQPSPAADPAPAPAAGPSPAAAKPGETDSGKPVDKKPEAQGTSAPPPKAAEEKPAVPGTPPASAPKPTESRPAAEKPAAPGAPAGTAKPTGERPPAPTAAAPGAGAPPGPSRPPASPPSDRPSAARPTGESPPTPPPPDRPRSGAGGPPPPGAPPPTAGRAGLGIGFAGGLVGGALMALLAFLLFVPRTDAPDEEAVEARIAERVGALEGRLDERIAALEAREIPLAEPEEVGAVEDRLLELEGALQELRQAGETGAIDLSGMADRLASLEAAAAETRETVQAWAEPDLEPLTAGLAALTDELAATRAEVEQSAEAARAELAELRERVEGLAEPVAGIPELTTRVESLGEELTTQVTALAERIETLDAGLADVTQVAGQTRERLEADDRRVRHALALAVATARAQEWLRGTQPLAGVVEVLAPVAETDPEVAAATETLRGAAAVGVPTLAELRRTFPADAIRRADDADDRGLLEEAAGNVLGLVTVRRHDAPADDVNAAVARAEDRLAEGDLAGAVAVVERLEGAPAEAATGWLERAHARLAAEAAVADLQARTDRLLGASL